MSASATAGTYTDSISGCTGLSLSGTNGPYYTIAYTDGAFTVNPSPLARHRDRHAPLQRSGHLRLGPTTLTPIRGHRGDGTLSGCTTSESNTAAFGIYQGTISHCSGLSFSGTKGGDYAVSYSDGGVTVVAGPVHVPVTGSLTYLGSPTFTAGSATLPSGVTAVTGTLTGCRTTVRNNFDVGTYPGTITGCSGLGLSGSTASHYAVVLRR